MTFIRLKTRKNSKNRRSHYAYLVENRWLRSKQRPKQRVREYLGKALKPDKNPGDFLLYMAMDLDEYAAKPYYEMLSDLVKWELHQHSVLDVDIDISTGDVRRKGQRIVVAMNQGFLCDHSLKRLIRVERDKNESQPGYMLASALVEAGVQAPKEIFIALYEKLNGSV
jgi:hypothetical protein